MSPERSYAATLGRSNRLAREAQTLATRDNNPSLGNTVSKVAEQLNQLDLQYQFNLYAGRFTIGGLINDSTINQSSETNFNVYFNYQITLK